MKFGPTEPGQGVRRLRLWAAAVGVRVFAVAAIAAMLLVTLGDARWLVFWREASRPVASGVDSQVLAGPAWPHWRGPGWTGRSDEHGLADTWAPEGPPLLWTRELGQGYAAFIAVGDRVYTQTQTLTGQYVICLDGDTGETIWQFRYAWPYEAGGMYPGPRATPTWHDGRIYFADPRGLVGCMRASDGEPVWQVNVKDVFEGRGTDFGYSCSPLIEDGKVILPVGGAAASLVALDARDGSTVWTCGSEPASYCPAMPIQLDGRRYVVALMQNALVVADLSSGSLVQQSTYSHGYDEHAAAPLYEEPYLLIASPFRKGAQCYRLEAVRGGVALAPVWHSRELSNDVASSVLVDGYVYGFDVRDIQTKAHRPSRGQFRCLDWKTGKTVWSTDCTGHASVIAADGKLLLLNDRGEALLVRADPKGYEELGRVSVFPGELCWTAPAFERGRLYLRSPSKGACLYVGEPEQRPERPIASVRPASESPHWRSLDLMWWLGGEREYVFDTPDVHELGLWYAFCLCGVVLPGLVFGELTYLMLRLVPRWALSGTRAAGQRVRPGGDGSDACNGTGERIASVARESLVRRGTGRVVMWGSMFVFGMVGTAVYNRLCWQFVFTWPVCLFVAHQVTLNTVVWAGRQAIGWRRRGLPMTAVFCFVAVCMVYYLVCRRLSLANEWAFLLGFLPSWPVAVPTAYQMQRVGRRWITHFLLVLSFSAFFWAAAVILCRGPRL